MKVIIGYLFVCLIISVTSLVFILESNEILISIKPFVYCCYSGFFGGLVYCLRGIYLNASVKENWKDTWKVWYIIRPWVSGVTGGVSFIFLKTGLLILDSTEGEASVYTFLALAFIAGFNVDKFLNRIEAVAKSSFGINESGISRKSEER